MALGRKMWAPGFASVDKLKEEFLVWWRSLQPVECLRCRVDNLISVSFAGSDFIQAIPTRFNQVREFPFKEESGEKLKD
jgi:hypothetical protein